MPLLPECLVSQLNDDGAVEARLEADRLSEWDVERVRAALFDLAERLPGRVLRLDLGRLEHLGSTGLALLVGLHRRVLATGGHLSLHNVRRPLYALLCLSRLNAILDVRAAPDADDATTTAA